MKLATTLPLLLTFFSFTAIANTTYRSYGKAINASSATPVVTAKVVEVCKKKGCWMKVEHAGTTRMVRFEDYGFFVPTDLVGKTVKMQAVEVNRKISEKEARHLLEDAGAPASEIAKVKGSREEVEFLASGVEVLD